MRFTHLAEQIYHRPWFITAGAHASIRLVFERALSSGLFDVGAGLSRDKTGAEDNPIADLFPKRRPLAIDSDGIASIHIMGPIGKNLSKIEQSCGATSIEQVRAEHKLAVQNGARGILLDFDSPGGTITGTPELAALIAQKPVPTVAYTEDIMASAAYYLAAGADAIVAAPSAEVGSIGVYIPWMDSSARYEAAGLKPDPIVNTGGDLKAIGFGGKLTDEQRAYLQADVDGAFNDFKSHVLRHRAVSPDAMRGQCLSGEAAKAASLIDVIGDRDHALGVLRSMMPAGAAAAA